MQAIVITTRPTNEHDLLVTCYTRERGKLTAVAKSALKHSSTQAMHLDPLTTVDFELIDGRSYPIIASAQSERSHARLKASPLATAMASFFAEVVERIVYDGERDDELWDVLTGALADLDEAAGAGTDALFEVFRARQFALVDTLGYAPQAAGCVVCGATPPREGWLLSPEHGGLVCTQCAGQGVHGIIVSRQDLALLRGESRGHSATRSALDTLFEHLAAAPLASLSLVYRLASRTGPVVY